MTICPRCGTQNLSVTAACMLCGNKLEALPPNPGLGKTVQLPARATPPHEPAPTLGQTLELPAPQATAKPEASLGQTLVLPSKNPGTPGLRSTVLGLGVPLPAKTASAQVDVSNVEAQSPHPEVSHSPKPHTRTMLGMAPKELVRPVAANTSVDSDPAAQPASGAGPAALPHTKTILGVARPGIAPLNPGIQKSGGPPGAAFPSPPPPPPLPGPELPPGPKPAGAKTLTLRAAKKSSRLAISAILAALGLISVGIGAFFWFSGPGTLKARVVLDAEGRERITLGCERCEDGTKVRLGTTESTFQKHQASLPGPGSLRVGDNLIRLSIQPPNSSREHQVEMSVRIDFRVRADLAQLSEPAPKLRVLVHAVPKSTVSVDDKAVSLDPSGQASVVFDVTQELTGQDPSVRRLERRIRYAVVPPGASSQVGHVVVQLGIAALVVEAPGESIVIESPTFVLAGRTGKGGDVSVESRPLLVSSEGRFAQVMNVSSVGETTITVRASAPDHAPRLYPIRVRRVESFAQEAAKERARSTTSYAGISDSTNDKRGWRIALDGSVLDRSKLEHSTVILFDASSGCRVGPCLSRVRYGVPTELVPGDRASVFGRVVGSVEGPRRGSQIPEIIADFIMKRP